MFRPGRTNLKLWVVRNSLGQYMGSYYARSAAHAINRFLSANPQPRKWADPKTYTAIHMGYGDRT